ncbi:MAG: type I DNA topoisomerase [Lachnospiraceae bacterium]|nr:type I DNA topoisomerase [Lachnospiraceae bacterium]
MAKNLVIVESPSKASTIKKFLGSSYQVVASNGHVRDLPKSQLGVDTENDYEPKYITIRGKGDVLAELRKEVKKADKVYLATDPDREGEAISWHLEKALKLDEMKANKEKKVARITFNEITKTAVKEAIKNGRDIDMNLVDAQQARRVLDRVVGYRISPVLWAKVKRGLSAGRVQSVALKIICDRENEINNFVQKEYWTLTGNFSLEGEKKSFEAEYYGKGDKKVEINNEEEAQKIIDDIEGKKFLVSDIKTQIKTRKAPLPFTTSTLQQEASKNLNFSTQKTMRVAQGLYEGIAIKGRGTIGLITYLRTDSTRISEEAEKAAAEYIENTFGEKYLKAKAASKKKGSGVKIQDAHEAIRPTYIDLDPASAKKYLTNDQFKLYQLIWKRFTASQMAGAEFENKNIKITAGDHKFSASVSKVVFAGYLDVYQQKEDKTQKKYISSKLEEGKELNLVNMEKKQHFTAPPAHFNEASLVKTLEELGIGRPSTYAPTISTIINRHYVAKEQKNLYVTEIGEAVNNIMENSFESIVNVRFTANMEGLLDRVEDGSVKWKTIIENFYPDLDVAVKKAEEELEHVELKYEETDEICENCGRNMVIKYGPYGKFLACPGFPECRNTKPYFESTDIKCPVCGKDIVIRKTKKGRRYYGCIGFPDCDFMSWQQPSDKKCPKCGSPMVIKGNKVVCMSETCGYAMENEKDKKDDKKDK